MNRYVAFLRGINVSGHHKLPMAELRSKLSALGYDHVVTILNSGNVIFSANSEDIEKIEATIASHLEESYGFPVPTIVRKAEFLKKLITTDPFKDIKVTKDIRLYISFGKGHLQTDLTLPWKSDDGAYQILQVSEHTIMSVLDLAVSKTTKAMDALEKFYGKHITTRNWNTIKRVDQKL
ncbi:MAG: DUF1697 domain-containing protein [Bacteroidota bacterium]